MIKTCKTHVFVALRQPRTSFLTFVFYEKKIKTTEIKRSNIFTEIKQSNINLIKLILLNENSKQQTSWPGNAPNLPCVW